MSKSKKILYKSTVGVLIFLIICTFLSKSIATAILPAVEVINPFAMDFTVSNEYTGEAVYESIYEIIYDFPLHVINILVETGDSVNEGDALIEVDGREYYLEMRRRELNIIQLENMILQSTDDDFISRLRLQIELEEEDLRAYMERYPVDGKIYAKTNGVIFNINAQEGETISPGVSLIELYDANSESMVVFWLNAHEAQTYNIGAGVTLFYREGSAASEVETRVSGREYDEESNSYIFSVPISSEYIAHGQAVMLKITNITPEYERVIPASAVIAMSNNRHGVYIVREREGLFGPEYVIRLVEIEIEDNNNLYVALSGWNVMAFDEVVIWSSRWLTSGEVVRVVNR
jgi:hypothetical protein